MKVCRREFRMVFKTFLKVVNKCKFPIILYTAILLFFAGINTTTNETTLDFTAEKPDILVINNDKEEGITKNFLEYLDENTTIKKDIKDDEKSIKDALFYRDVQYIVYIPENFNEKFMAGKNPAIEVKSTGEYQSSLANMIVERYMKIANNYVASTNSEEELFAKIKTTLDKKADVEVTSHMDTKAISRLGVFYNFAAYCFIAISIYVICTILMIFNEEKISKRTMIGSTDYKKINFKLLVANSIFCVLVWAVYWIFARILIGEIAFSKYGCMMSLNALIFVSSTVTFGFLLSKFIKDKNAITAIVNVIGLGSSFLCGVFVPMQFLPDSVLHIARVLPAYWYVSNNELIGNSEYFTAEVFKNFGINSAVLIGFAFVFFVITNIVSKRKKA